MPLAVRYGPGAIGRTKAVTQANARVGTARRGLLCRCSKVLFKTQLAE